MKANGRDRDADCAQRSDRHAVPPPEFTLRPYSDAHHGDRLSNATGHTPLLLDALSGAVLSVTPPLPRVPRDTLLSTVVGISFFPTPLFRGQHFVRPETCYVRLFGAACVCWDGLPSTTRAPTNQPPLHQKLLHVVVLCTCCRAIVRVPSSPRHVGA